MAAKTETFTANLAVGDKEPRDYNFAVTQLPPTQAIKLTKKLITFFGSAFDKVLGAALKDIDVGELAMALQGVFAVMSDTDVDKFLEDLLSNVVLNDGEKFLKLAKGTFDLYFAGANLEGLKLLGFVLKVNFGDFFHGSGGSPTA